jgi:hypothetical protein
MGTLGRLTELRQHDDRGPVLCLPQPPAHLATIQARHPNIQDEEIGLLLAGQSQCVDTIVCDSDRETAALKERRKRRGDSFVIVG